MHDYVPRMIVTLLVALGRRIELPCLYMTRFGCTFVLQAALFSSASSASLSQAALRQGLFENIITHSLKSHRSSYPVATVSAL